MGLSSEQAKVARSMVQLAPGRCQAIDPRTGIRCTYTWEASQPRRRYCARCQARLSKRRHRQRLREAQS